MHGALMNGWRSVAQIKSEVDGPSIEQARDGTIYLSDGVQLEAGEFWPGIDPLPSEKDLQELFEVARDTARRVVAVLRDEGLVVTVPQRGTYVAER